MDIRRNSLKLKELREFVHKTVLEYHFTKKELDILRKDVLNFISMESNKLNMNKKDTYKFINHVLNSGTVSANLK